MIKSIAYACFRAATKVLMAAKGAWFRFVFTPWAPGPWPRIGSSYLSVTWDTPPSTKCRPAERRAFPAPSQRFYGLCHRFYVLGCNAGPALKLNLVSNASPRGQIRILPG
jgi:hypothetical protein